MRAPGHGAQLWDLHQFFGVQRQPSSPGVRAWVLNPLGCQKPPGTRAGLAIITPSLGRFAFFLAFLLFFFGFSALPSPDLTPHFLKSLFPKGFFFFFPIGIP